MGDNRKLTFEACWGGEHVVSSVEVDGEDIIVSPVSGGRNMPTLVIRLDVFELLTTRAIVAAHTTTGADRG